MSFGVMVCPACGEPADFGVSMPRFSTRPEHQVDRITCRRCGLTTLPEELVLEKHRNILKGGPLSIPATPPPVHVPVSRVARGKGTGTSTDASGAYAISASVTVGTTGSTLIVFIGADESGGSVTSVTWNGTLMSAGPAVSEFSTFNSLRCFVLSNASAGTGALVIDDGGIQIGRWEFVASEVVGAAASSLDVSASATGTSTAPSSGNTAATSQAAEMLFGVIWRAKSVIDGNTAGSILISTLGQTTTQTGRSMEEYFKVISSIGSYNAAKSGCTSSLWLAIAVTIKEN